MWERATGRVTVFTTFHKRVTDDVGACYRPRYRFYHVSIACYRPPRLGFYNTKAGGDGVEPCWQLALYEEVLLNGVTTAVHLTRSQLARK